MKKNTISAPTIAVLGAGAVALAASTYYFFGPEGKIHRQRAAGWMVKMKGEIIEKISEAQEITENSYHEIVDSVLASYVQSGKVTGPELEKFAKNLKGQWKQILKKLPKKPKKASVSKSKTGTKNKKKA